MVHSWASGAWMEAGLWSLQFLPPDTRAPCPDAPPPPAGQGRGGAEAQAAHQTGGRWVHEGCATQHMPCPAVFACHASRRCETTPGRCWGVRGVLCWHATPALCGLRGSCTDLPPACCAVGEKMRGLLVDMKKAHPGQDDALKTCWQTLLKMCGNVYNNPGERPRWAGARRARRRLRLVRFCWCALRLLGSASHRLAPVGCALHGKDDACKPGWRRPCRSTCRSTCRGGQVPPRAADQPGHPAARGGLQRRSRLFAAGGLPEGRVGGGPGDARRQGGLGGGGGALSAVPLRASRLLAAREAHR